ncbi:endonuclease/exonuclease/phosphatase family protein [Vibrio vulnificus]|uniref:endonuclease/exonuclease/phosphatase family protein n=1 Tax=Vibrio vulnificus TaxID=672 RepID=UPI0009B63F4F|nr:endonuclease/exonuclease/phosphatase family protein [Vibrio vulnificus]EHU4926848.1 endonuclease/exonuclease/phosphatase family protein [Vibrio vulnificus]EIT7020404.1 endonuclease/exonuclease/phosphatase family protein [Vibrio vulnificus]EIV8619538.1 endonuclease/exonuclease/phosphatase family protein [Vibrio vulnificus]EIX4887429.1 endonuclease/exonuclease/phosphatase family protein [Vibrio vulnificus]EIZ1408920.1 endonuclease/exonuclease/phosphatase family protein [Vibrio vulnificus]
MFTIASCNLFNFLAPPGAFYEFSNILDNQQWQKKRNWLTKMLKKMDADVVAFQEVFSIEALRQLTLAAGYPYFVCLDHPHVQQEHIYTDPVLAIASRWPIEQSRLVTFQDVMEESDKVTNNLQFSRCPVHAVVEHPEIGHCDIINVHLKSQRSTSLARYSIENEQNELTLASLGSWLSTVQRGWEALFIKRYLSLQYQNSPRPMVILGDFNAKLNSGELSPLCDLLSIPRLKDMRYWCSDKAKASAPTHYHGNQGIILDYILLSEEFDRDNALHCAKVESIQIWDQHLTNPCFEHDQFSSDHAFVSVTLSARE